MSLIMESLKDMLEILLTPVFSIFFAMVAMISIFKIIRLMFFTDGSIFREKKEKKEEKKRIDF